MTKPVNTERDRRIFELRRDKLSGSKIAAKLGLTRSAVMGVLYRAKLKNAAEFVAPLSEVIKPVVKAQKLKAKRTPPVPVEKVAPVEVPKPVSGTKSFVSDWFEHANGDLIPRLRKDPSDLQGVSLMNIGFGQCRYVLKDETYRGLAVMCGKPVDRDAAWCMEHRKLCYSGVPGKPFVRLPVRTRDLRKDNSNAY